jgi:DNA invertase Pin-like site-specific DNA recombinase/ribosomal protein S27AE
MREPIVHTVGDECNERNRNITGFAPTPSRAKAIIYARVSTKDQDTETQIHMGKQLAYKRGFTDQNIVCYIDHGVSARKNSMHERNALNEALRLIQEGDVACFIIRDRDRLARNMIEYLHLYQILRNAGVELVLSDPGAVPVSDNLGNEALHALMAEIDGNTIAHRTKTVARYYPPAPLGYRKVGRKSDTRYEWTTEIAEVQRMFYHFNRVRNADEYRNFRRMWKQRIGRYPDEILCNGLYAGVLIEDGKVVDTLRHIVPIVDAACILENRKKLSDWGFYDEMSKKAGPKRPKVSLLVECERCGVSMTAKSRRGVVTYVCGKCSKIRVSEEYLWEILENVVLSLVQNIDPAKLEKLTLMTIKKLRKKETAQLVALRAKQKDIRRQVLDTLVGDDGYVGRFIQEDQELQRRIDARERNVQELNRLIDSIQQLLVTIKQDVRKYSSEHILSLTELLCVKVVVGTSTITVVHGFADLQEEGEQT